MVYHRIFKLKESEVWKVRLAFCRTELVLRMQDWKQRQEQQHATEEVPGQLASAPRAVTLHWLPGTLPCFTSTLNPSAEAEAPPLRREVCQGAQAFQYLTNLY